jgi:hypothetical protein
MAKKQANGAGNGAPKKAGPPDNALPLDETTISVPEILTDNERQAQAELASAEYDLLEAARKKSASLKALLKASRDDERAHGQRYEQISHEATSGRRMVDVVVRPYRHFDDGKVHFYDPVTGNEVGTPRDATDADRQGALPTRTPTGDNFADEDGGAA